MTDLPKKSMKSLVVRRFRGKWEVWFNRTGMPTFIEASYPTREQALDYARWAAAHSWRNFAAIFVEKDAA